MANKIDKIQLPDGQVLELDSKSQITNCLLEVPQRIKLELNDGVLTLKAGSQVIVPNGFEADGTTPKFDYVDIPSDLILNRSSWHTSLKYVYVIQNSVYPRYFNTGQCFSGATAPTGGTYLLWFDTTNNLIKESQDGGATWTGRKASFPVCLFSANGNQVTSIDQVFNGMGYIGNTIFCDKEVKGLIPNGFNIDGTLNNIEFTTSGVLTATCNISGNNLNLGLSRNNFLNFISNNYRQDLNINVNSEGLNTHSAIVGTWSADSTGRITSFQPKLTFRAVDYNDLNEIYNDLNEIKPRIGQPQLSLDNVLPSNCVWLEGATVSRTTYSKLFAIYGTTYGEGDGSTTFVLPNFLNRAVWGSNGFGYIVAGLPNITGNIKIMSYGSGSIDGAFNIGVSTGGRFAEGSDAILYNTSFDASRSNSIYGNNTTVQPPAIKVRVYARYQ